MLGESGHLRNSHGMLLGRSAVDVSSRHQEWCCDAAIQAACHVGAQLEGRHVVVVCAMSFLEL